MITRQLTEEEEELLRDGETRRIPLLLMDAVQRSVAADPERRDNGNLQIIDAFGQLAGHAPGYCFANVPGDTRPQAYRQYVDHLSDAWKQPSQMAAAPAPGRSSSSGSAREEYIKQIGNAWRNT